MSQFLVAIVAKKTAVQLLPIPVAQYDVRNYDSINQPSVLPVTAGSEYGAATLNLGSQNTYDDSDPANPYINIYGPNIFPSQTGGVLAPSISDVRTIEIWCRIPDPQGYGQYFLDFRTGGGFMITSTSEGSNSGNVIGAPMYINTTSQTITETTNMSTIINGSTWRQVVIVFEFPFEDDCAFFMRFNSGDQFEFVQGCPVDFGEISIYNTALTAQNVIDIFNAKCSRYGLSPV
jgi:hypothetical protein